MLPAVPATIIHPLCQGPFKVGPTKTFEMKCPPLVVNPDTSIITEIAVDGTEADKSTLVGVVGNGVMPKGDSTSAYTSLSF